MTHEQRTVFGPLDAYNLTGQTAIVTGAAGGLGRASAILLAAVGANVVVADIDDAGSIETVQQIVDSGGVASARRVDVAVRADVAAAVAFTCETYGCLDIFATIAGIGGIPTPLRQLDDDALDRVLAVNLKGTLYGCQEAARVMVPRGRGCLVTMASTAIDLPNLPGIGAYGISKAAVVQLTRVLAQELGPHGIRVNALAPGPILTSITERHWTASDGSVDEAARERVLDQLTSMSPMGQLGSVQDIAHAVLYLASPASGFVTGQILRPNGGSAMPW